MTESEDIHCTVPFQSEFMITPKEKAVPHHTELCQPACFRRARSAQYGTAQLALVIVYTYFNSIPGTSGECKHNISSCSLSSLLRFASISSSLCCFLSFHSRNSLIATLISNKLINALHHNITVLSLFSFSSGYYTSAKTVAYLSDSLHTKVNEITSSLLVVFQ